MCLTAREKKDRGSKNNRILHKTDRKLRNDHSKKSTFGEVCPFMHTLSGLQKLLHQCSVAWRKSACAVECLVVFSSFVMLGLVPLIFPFDNSLLSKGYWLAN